MASKRDDYDYDYDCGREERVNARPSVRRGGEERGRQDNI